MPLRSVAFPPPCPSDFRTFLNGARSSAPGPDGLRYDAWRFGGHRAHGSLSLVAENLRCGIRRPCGFNRGIAVFPPKNVTASETLNGALRRPADTQPLSLKDASNKSIASVVNRAWRTALAEELGPCQQGFLAGRIPSRNIVDIDYKGKCFALEPEGPDPVIVLFDFIAFYPSLSH